MTLEQETPDQVKEAGQGAVEREEAGLDCTVIQTGNQDDKQVLAAALRYAAEWGWPVFPCRPDKRPYTTHGFKDASRDPEQIKEWWSRWPDALVGLPTGATSNTLVVDVDMKNGVDGKASLAALQNKYGALPKTRISRTRSGGFHLFFKHVDGVKNSAGKLGLGLDIRTTGGYVILPGSPGYSWHSEAKIASAPHWLVDLLSRLTQREPERKPTKPTTGAAVFADGAPTPYGQAALAGILAEMSGAANGQRNDTLNKLAFRVHSLIAGGELPESALGELKAAALATGLGAEEVDRTIASAAAGRAEPAAAPGRAFAEAEAEIAALAALPVAEYERQRKDAAKRLGFSRVSALDGAVKALRAENAAQEELPFKVDAPWPDPVEPAALLDEIAVTVKRFIVLPTPAAADAVALWVAMTYVMEAVDVAPLLIISAPERQCGKSLLLSLIGKLAARAIVASNISAAALYRSVEKWTPTLLLDECDAALKDNEELRGILNSGHTRDSAFVIRTVGEDFTPTRFSTWGPKILCGIGRLPGTLEDRAILLEMRRRLPGERVSRMGEAEPGLFDGLRSKLSRFGGDYSEAVRLARPALLDRLSDRQMDNWGSLLKIAMVAGQGWEKTATEAALALCGRAEASPAIGTQLLESIRAAFQSSGADRLDSAGLIMALCADGEAPWRTFNRGQPITTRQLASYLKGYGILSGTIRQKDGTIKGYYLKSFKDAFERYAPEKDIFS